jgi:hypothetical protein
LHFGGNFLIKCDNCGIENEADASFCVNCGAPFKAVEYKPKNPKDECFGLPNGGAIFGLFIGAIIIIWGLTEVLGLQIDIWNYAIIVIGILIVVGAIYGLTKRK